MDKTSGGAKKKKTVTFSEVVHANDGSDMPLKGGANKATMPNDLTEEEKARIAEEKRRAQEEAERKERHPAEAAKIRPSVSISSPSNKDTKGLSYAEMSALYRQGQGQYQPKPTNEGYEFHIDPGKVKMSTKNGRDTWEVEGKIKAPKVITFHDKDGKLREVITIGSDGRIQDYKGWNAAGKEVGPDASEKFDREFLKAQGAKGPQVNVKGFASPMLEQGNGHDRGGSGATLTLENVELESKSKPKTAAANRVAENEAAASKLGITTGTVKEKVDTINKITGKNGFAPSPNVNHRGETEKNLTSFMKSRSPSEFGRENISPSAGGGKLVTKAQRR